MAYYAFFYRSGELGLGDEVPREALALTMVDTKAQAQALQSVLARLANKDGRGRLFIPGAEHKHTDGDVGEVKRAAVRFCNLVLPQLAKEKKQRRRR